MTVVNLNKARKSRAKTEKKAKADENSVRFGRTKADKLSEAAKLKKARDLLDGHRRDD